jgi:hypothetical protein
MARREVKSLVNILRVVRYDEAEGWMCDGELCYLVG